MTFYSLQPRFSRPAARSLVVRDLDLHPWALRLGSRLDPYAEFNALSSQLDHFFDHGVGHSKISRPWPRNPAPVEVAEKDGIVTLKMDLPGVKPEELKLKVKDDVLTISGERTDSIIEKEDEDNTAQYSERFSGSFSRSFHLHPNVQPGDVTAEFENGVLVVKFPTSKAVEDQGFEVPVTPVGTKQLDVGAADVSSETPKETQPAPASASKSHE